MVNNTVENFQKENILSKKTAEDLKIFDPKTPKFIIRPKIHKENNPGRPVISSINYHASEISRFLDHYLLSVAKEIPSYIKDTNDFIKKSQ